MPESPWLQVRAALLDSDELVRAVASGRQRNCVVPWRRAELRYVDLKAGRHLQVTTYDETQAHTRNAAPGAPAAAVVDELLDAGFANWHVDCRAETLQLRVSRKGRVQVHAGTRAVPEDLALDRSHDRAKRRLLEPTEPVFHLLGLTTAQGVVKPSRMAKFHQVQDFLAAVDPLIEDLAGQRPLRIVDLGCGNAYLTFALHRYLSAVRELPVHVVGVDVKQQARSRNAAIAEALGVSDAVTFVVGRIASAEVEERPDVVLALHACDTATDEALARAVAWQAPVVVAAPCCHHDIARQLASAAGPAPYRLLTRHGILRERFAEVLTDALRAALLRLVGYRVDVVEFVESRHTPRNVLIRGVRTGARPSDDVVDAYRELVDQWEVTPALETELGTAVPGLATALGRE